MNKKYLWSVIAIIILVIIIAVASNKKAPTPVGTKEPIKIGAILSLTGIASPWGEYGKKGIELAVKTINASGGIDGRQVQVVIEDDRTDPKQAVSAFTKLTSLDHVQALIGGNFDFTSQPLLPLASSTKIAYISPANPRIPGGYENNSQTFVLMPDFSVIIRNMKDYLVGTDVKKLAVVHFKSSFGAEIAKTLDAVMKENGKAGIIDEPYDSIGSNDFRTTIIKLKSQGVDTVFLDMVGGDPLNFITRAKQIGLKATIIGYNGLIDSFTNEKDKSLLENVVILNWEVNSDAFQQKYLAEYGGVPAKSSDKFFDSVYVLANAIAKAVPASGDISQVASYIEQNTFTTPNSTIAFTKEHTVSTTPVKVGVIKGGVFTLWEK